MSVEIVNPLDDPEPDPADRTAEAVPRGQLQAKSALGPSARKIEANRKNAQASTGPRTPQGKARSRQNATKHGLHQTIPAAIAQGPFAEKSEDIETFVTSVVENLNPRDDLESALATNIARELLRAARLDRVEAALLEHASTRPADRHHENQRLLEAAQDLKSYLEDPSFEKPGDWRQHICSFISQHTDGWAHPTIPPTAPPEHLRRLIHSRWGGDKNAALTWVQDRLAELEEKHRLLGPWDEGEAAQDLVAALMKILTLSTKNTRNLQRLLAEYRQLQHRRLGDTPLGNAEN